LCDYFYSVKLLGYIHCTGTHFKNWESIRN